MSKKLNYSQTTLNNFATESIDLNKSYSQPFNYLENIVKKKDQNQTNCKLDSFLKNYAKKNNITSFPPTKKVQPSIFSSLLEPKKTVEISESLFKKKDLLSKKRKNPEDDEDLEKIKQILERRKVKKNIKKKTIILNKDKQLPNKNENHIIIKPQKPKVNFLYEALGKTEEEVNIMYEEEKKKSEKERLAILKNENIEKKLMGSKKKVFDIDENKIIDLTKNEDSGQKMPIIFPVKRKFDNLNLYVNFRYYANEIYWKILSFDFFRQKQKIEKVPDTFDNEMHYRYIWLNDFFNELKFCLMDEKVEKSEIQSYNEMDIRLRFNYLGELDSTVSLLRIIPNKKLNELKKRILKDKDIVAIYNEKSDIKPEKINFTNTNNLRYFLGIVKKDIDSSDINLMVLREIAEKFKDSGNSLVNEIYYKNNNNGEIIHSSSYLYKVRYLGSLISPSREYQALLDLNIADFTGIIRTGEYCNKIINNADINNFNFNENENLNIKEKFLLNLKNSKIYNDSQKNAIFKANSMKDNEILLIQGPPGTGKTHTILGLISLFLLNKKNKILVCAPSNAAIDEISARLATKGVFNYNLEKIKCMFVRFGLYDRKDKEKKYLDTMNGKILEKYSLEYLSDKEFKPTVENLQFKIEKKNIELEELNKDKEKNKNYINCLVAEKTNLLNKLYDIRHDRLNYEESILLKSNVLCTTLNSSGSEKLRRVKVSYEYLIIDEACQSVEPSNLIPLCHNVKKLILVGDHMQLPATVFCPKAADILYNRSLFERLIDNHYSRNILTVQYRMQAKICKFISDNFYEKKLINDFDYSKNVDNEPIYDIININKNFALFDICNSKESYDLNSKSYYNEKEIEFCFILLKKIMKNIYEKIKIEKSKKNSEEGEIIENLSEKNSNIDIIINKLENYKFAIITPYKEQVKKLKIKKREDKILSKLSNIEINTVDSFQGQERSIVIFSTVRSNFGGNETPEKGEIENSPNSETNTNDNSNGGVGIGFLNDYRRMNVGLSRAKEACFIVGNSDTLKNNSYWNKLIVYCKENDNFYQIKNDDVKSYLNYIKNVFI